MKPEDDDISSKKNLGRLTANGRRVLWKAEVEATTLGQHSVGALHIFIAILRSPKTAAARVLQSIRFDLESLADEPICLVLGAEGDGLSRLVRQRCDSVVAIPMLGNVSSLNVSAAAALSTYEITRGRRQSP